MKLAEIIARSLSWVEHIYGESHPDVRLLDVDISDEHRSAFTAYPDESWENIIIVLSDKYLEEHQLYQIFTHELVHCLRPNGPPSLQATYFEEGLAEHSSIYFMEENYSFVDEFGNIDQSFWRNFTDDRYKRAFNLIEQVISYEGIERFRAQVRVMRDVDGDRNVRLCDITPDIMAVHFPNTPRSVLDALGRRLADDQKISH